MDRQQPGVESATDVASRLRRPPSGRSGVFTVSQVADRLQITARHVSDLIEEGQIEAIDVSSPESARKSWRIPFEAYLKYLDKRHYG